MATSFVESSSVTQDGWGKKPAHRGRRPNVNTMSAADVAFRGVSRGESNDFSLADDESWDSSDPCASKNDSKDEDWMAFDDDESVFSECESDFVSGASERRKFAEKVKNKAARSRSGNVGTKDSLPSSNIKPTQALKDFDGSMASLWSASDGSLESNSSLGASFFGDIRAGRRSTENSKAMESQNSCRSLVTDPGTRKAKQTLEAVIHRDKPIRPRGSCQSVPDYNKEKKNGPTSTKRNEDPEEADPFKSVYKPPTKKLETLPKTLSDVIMSEKSHSGRSVPKKVMPNCKPEPLDFDSEARGGGMSESLKASQAFYANKGGYRQRRRASFGSGTEAKGRSPDMDNSMRTPSSPCGSLGTSSLSLGETLTKDKNRRQSSGSVGSSGSKGSRGSRSSKGLSVSSAPVAASSNRRDRDRSRRNRQGIGSSATGSTRSGKSGGNHRRARRQSLGQDSVDSAEEDNQRIRRPRRGSAGHGSATAEERPTTVNRRPRQRLDGVSKGEKSRKGSARNLALEKEPSARRLREKPPSQRRLTRHSSTGSTENRSRRNLKEDSKDKEKMMESRLSLMSSHHSKRKIKDPEEQAFQQENPEVGTSASRDASGTTRGRAANGGSSRNLCRGRSRSRSRSRCRSDADRRSVADMSLHALEDSEPRGAPQPTKSNEYLPMGLYGVGGGGNSGDMTSESESEGPSSSSSVLRKSRAVSMRSRSRSRSVSRSVCRR